jgi:hypothetical protein
MRFHAPEVSASVSGDYYQLYLGPEEDEEDDPFEVAGPYLLLQREFEMSGRRCYIESENESYIGHFALKLIEFSPSLLSFDIVRARDNHVEVSFALDAKNFEVVRRVAEVIFGLREPDEGDAL